MTLELIFATKILLLWLFGYLMPRVLKVELRCSLVSRVLAFTRSLYKLGIVTHYYNPSPWRGWGRGVRISRLSSAIPGMWGHLCWRLFKKCAKAVVLDTIKTPCINENGICALPLSPIINIWSEVFWKVYKWVQNFLRDSNKCWVITIKWKWPRLSTLLSSDRIFP